MRRGDHKLGNHLPHASGLERHPDLESEEDVVKKHEEKHWCKRTKDERGKKGEKRKAWCLLPPSSLYSSLSITPSAG